MLSKLWRIGTKSTAVSAILKKKFKWYNKKIGDEDKTSVAYFLSEFDEKLRLNIYVNQKNNGVMVKIHLR